MLSKGNLIRLAGAAACVAAFVCISGINLAKFDSGRTTLTSTRKPSDRLMLPAITFCNATGFKEDRTMSGLADFLENTVKLEEIFDKLGRLFGDLEGGEIGTVKPLYGKYKGHCFTYNFPHEVTAMEGLIFNIVQGAEFRFAIHEPGEEFWLHIDYYLGDPLEMSVYRRDTYMCDIRINKEVTKQVKGCREWTSQEYYACIVDEYKRFRMTHNYANCSNHWSMSMMGILEYDDSNPCTEEEIVPDMVLNSEFMIMLANNTLTSCWPPCEKSRYRYTVTQFGKTDGIAYIRLSTSGSIDRPMFFYYPTTDITVVEETLLMSLGDLVSAIGGNLGLFLGFSVLSIFFYFVGKVEAGEWRLPKRRKSGHTNVTSVATEEETGSSYVNGVDVVVWRVPSPGPPAKEDAPADGATHP